jgi:hypothetical protein
MEDMDFLLNILKLSDGIIKKDNALITTISNTFNSGKLTEEQEERIKSCLSSFIEGDSNNTNLTLKLAINSISSINKNYLLALITIRNINIYGNPIEAKQVITTKLSDTTIVFDNDRDKFTYYSFLVNLTIRTQDISLIKAAIDKIQSL